MNTVHRTILRLFKSSVSLLLTATLTASTVACDEAREPSARAAVADLDGEQLYAGVFFGIGPAADLLPEVHALSGRNGKTGKDLLPALHRTMQRLRDAGDADAAARVHQVIADMEEGIDPIADLEHHEAVARLAIAEIEWREPGFFVEFERELTSGDPFRVDAMMRRAAELSLAVTRNTVGRDENSSLGSVVALASVAAIGLFVWVVAYVTYWVEFSHSDALNPEDRLWHDELVARLTMAARR